MLVRFSVVCIPLLARNQASADAAGLFEQINIERDRSESKTRDACICVWEWEVTKKKKNYGELDDGRWRTTAVFAISKVERELGRNERKKENKWMNEITIETKGILFIAFIVTMN